MVLIAVAGGTSPTLGRSIATTINKTARNSAMILSSRADDPVVHGAEVRSVDYAFIPSLTTALTGVHTLVSVPKIRGRKAIECETNLLSASKAAGVKRFAPSAWKNGPLATERVTILAMNKPAVWQARLESGLEVVRFSGGVFMNYLALGSRREEAEQGLVDEAVIWDVPYGRMEMPIKGDGSVPRLTMTSIVDLGKFVAAACELSEG